MSEALIYFLLVIVILTVLWMVFVFNTLVKLNNQCREAWSDVDTELKRRYDLIPNLVTVVTAYARHERETLESVTRARNQAINSTGSPASQARDEDVLVGALQQLFVVVEGYPTLKADEHFLKLQQELVDTEDRIQAARRFYNANVRDFNTRLEVFPSNLIAHLSGFSREDFFEIQETGIRSAPQVNLS
jgi:LemA protein